jgi:hypothetical protein
MSDDLRKSNRFALVARPAIGAGNEQLQAMELLVQIHNIIVRTANAFAGTIEGHIAIKCFNRSS